MGRTNLAKASIKELDEYLKSCKERKEYFEQYLQNLYSAYSKGKINYHFYTETIHKYFDGKTLAQWIEYYDFQIKDCYIQIKKNREEKIKKKLVLLIFFSVFLFLILSSMNRVAIPLTGFSIEKSPEISENIVQQQAILGQPVKWIKTIVLENSSKTKITIPLEATNITLNKISFSDTKQKADFTLTGSVISEKKSNFLSKISALTGFAIEEQISEQEIEINDTSTNYEIIYETPAPTSQEEITEKGKRIIISGPKEIHYQNVLAFTILNENLNIKNTEQIRIYWVENDSYIAPSSLNDTNDNGIYDYVEWIIPHLSEQTFEIIVITKAEHMNENKEFISNIYEEVKELDGIWSEEISEEHYVRVKFERNLTNEKDITIYPKIFSGNPKVEVYEKNGNKIIAIFDSIKNNEYNKIYLTNLQSESQNIFDLRVVGGSIEFEHIIDPSDTYLIDADAEPYATGTGETAFYNGGKNIIKLDSGTLIAMWEDDGNDPMCELSTNGGKTWGTKGTLSATYRDMAIATNGTGIIFVTSNDASSTQDIEFETGTTCAITSLADVGSLTDHWRPDVAFNEISNRWFVCASDDDDHDTYIAHSPTSSISWTTVEVGNARTTDSCSIDVNDDGNVFVAIDDSGSSTIVVFNSSNSFSSTTTTTAYNAAVTNMHLSIRERTILITAQDTNNYLVVVWSTNGITYQNTTYPGIISGPEGCIDENGNFHIAFVNGSGIDYIKYSNGNFYNLETITTTGTEAYPSVRCTNFPSANRLGTDKLELVYTDTGTNIYFSNITIDTSIVTDEISPNLKIHHPLNQTYNAVRSLFNYTVADAEEIDICRYSLDNWATNTTITCGNNVSQLNSEQGQSIWKIYANDTSGNSNTSTISFFVDSINPLVKFNSPTSANNSNFSKNWVLINASYIETNPQNITFRIFNATGTWNSTDYISSNNASNISINFTGLADGFYNYNFTVRDIVTNLNTTENNRIFLDTSIPNFTKTQTNTTIAGTVVNFATFYDDVFWLNPNGQYIFSWNNSGIWANDSAVNFTSTPQWANVTKVLNETAGVVIGYRWYAYDNLKNSNNTLAFKLTTNSATNNAVKINVMNSTMTGTDVDPTLGGITPLKFYINVSDSDGNDEINTSSINASFSFHDSTLGTTRTNASCISKGILDANSLNFSCTINMQFYDIPGKWNITVYARDTENGTKRTNITQTFQYDILQAVSISPILIGFSSVSPGNTNVTSNNDPVLINNTGNFNFTAISINATDLYGNRNASEFIPAANFSIGNSTGVGSATDECGGGFNDTLLAHGIYKIIDKIFLLRGNYLLNDNSTGQEQLFICIKEIPSDISSQTYSTKAGWGWTIRILAVTFIPRRTKLRKNNKIFELLINLRIELKMNYSKEKEILIKQLIKAIQKEYSISKRNLLHSIKEKEENIPSEIFSKEIGALEVVVKYMKENLNMSYKEIADKLKRNERTIWTAYKKSREKQERPIQIKKSKLYIPLKIFKQNELTILESIIIYLKQQRLNFSEIAKILGRDQRNIWTIHFRAKNTLKIRDNNL